MKGKTGAKGPRGPKGVRGATGAIGRRGAIGKRGRTGIKGRKTRRPSGKPDVHEVTARLDRIQELADEGAKGRADVLNQTNLGERIHLEITAAKSALKRES